MLETAIARLADLVAMPTVSADPNRALIDRLAGDLAAIGARIRIQGDAVKANLVASFGPAVDGGIMLSGHTDVVPVAGQAWSVPPFALTERDGRLHGRGTADMKGFIACVMAALPALVARPPAQPLHLVLTHDEEVGCLGARALARLMAAEGPRPRLAIIGEPTGMRIVEGHKGCCEYRTEFHGLAGHGSDPARGVSAVEHAARYAAALIGLRGTLERRAPAHSRFHPPWTTLNIGRITGGEAANVIAEHAVIDWDLRPVQPADLAFVLEAIDSHAAALQAGMRRVHPAARIGRRTVGEVPPLLPGQANAARDLVARLTGENATGLVAFGTEAGIFQELGIDCVVCGPGEIAQAHMPDEFITREQMARCLAMLQRLADHLA